MQKQLIQVAQFQKTFGAGVGEKPRMITREKSQLRWSLLNEENDEYLKAVSDDNLTEIADALGDALYIVCGTILEHGLQHVIEEVFDNIHASNMSKTDENGNPIINGQNGVWDPKKPKGKVLKSNTYFSPDLKPILRKAMERDINAEVEHLLQEKELLENLKKNSSDFMVNVKYGQRLSEIGEQLIVLQSQN